jgi:hypothetical protein
MTTTASTGTTLTWTALSWCTARRQIAAVTVGTSTTTARCVMEPDDEGEIFFELIVVAIIAVVLAVLAVKYL